MSLVNPLGRNELQCTLLYVVILLASNNFILLEGEMLRINGDKHHGITLNQHE
jgi:hypothetical protein